MSTRESRDGRPGPRLVYACSGCSDAGEITDRAARRLARDGIAEMSCIAGIGGLVKPLVVKAERAERILAIDGCPLTCAKHSVERAGLSGFRHLNIVDLGLKKGRCPATDETVARVADAAAKLMREEAVAAWTRFRAFPVDSRSGIGVPSGPRDSVDQTVARERL